MRFDDISEGVAGPKNCWPGYRKVGTKPGTGKNAGKRVNDCEKIKKESALHQAVKEFAPSFDGGDDSNDGFSEETLKRLAAQWWKGDEDPRVERTLMAAGWEIGQDEGYDEGGVFVVQSGDVNGKSYISWSAEDLEGMAEGIGDEVNPADVGEYDREGDMAIGQLQTAEDAAAELRSILDADENLPEWVQSKITKAVDYLDTARDYMKGKEEQGVTEVSSDTLKSYQQKVSADSMKHPSDPTKRSSEKANRSVAGFAKAQKRLEKGVAEGAESTTATLDAVFNEHDFYRLEHIWPALEAGDKEEALRQINHYLRKGKNRAWWGDLQALDISIDPNDVENSQVVWNKSIKEDTPSGGSALGRAVKEAGWGRRSSYYNPLDQERREQDQMDYDKRAFKRAELQHELGHEDDPNFERNLRQQQIDRDRGPWYIRIDGKIYRQKGQPKSFDWKRGANNYALAMVKNNPSLQGRIMLTKSAEDK